MKKLIRCISPIDQQVFVERPLAQPGEIEATLSQAKSAQKDWRNTSIADRAEVCKKVVDHFVEKADEIGEEITRQMGRPIRYTPFELTKGFQERANYMIGIAEKALTDIEAEQVGGFQRFIRREPVGTVLVLAPWNYPYLTSVNAIIPAIMSGNTVILKHAEQTPLCSECYAEAFEAAGLPKGVFQYLHLSHTQVASVIQDERINYVAFTGSVKGGEAIQKAIGNRFITAGLELGGKDPAYVRSDANLENAIENLVDGSFFNSGQSCCGIERIYVHEKLYKDFVHGFVQMTETYQLGNPLEEGTTLGPMVRPSAALFAQQQVEAAVKAGAEQLVDLSKFSMHEPEKGYLAPQVLVGVNHAMDLMKTESFAPVIGIMPIKDDQEAIQLMNDSQYGLTASVWTKDIEAALTIGNQVETGTWFMNRCDYLDPALAWTGVKHSGKGCTLSVLGYEALTRPKSFHLKLSR